MARTIYLDNAATTPLRSEVFEAMLPYLRDTYGNPSSMHHIGRAAFDALREARALVADTLGVQSSEILFTGSGTEANNLALWGIARARGARDKHILISPIEHKSVLHTAEQLAREGFEVEYLPVDTFGRIDVANTLTRIRPDTILISVMYANNEIGTIEPVSELTEHIHNTFSENERPLIHTDACQATGQLDVSPHKLGVDLMTLNSSKIYGPKGVGMLYVRHGVSLTPLIVGGDQEFGKRSGTENVAGIVGFAHALALSAREQKQSAEKLTNLRDTFITSLREAIPEVMINGHLTERLPNNIHLSFPYIEGESLVLMLDTYGICASTGSACSASDLVPSHVLRAIGQDDDLMHGSLRLTLGRDTTEADLSYTRDVLTKSAATLRALSPLPLHL